VQVPESAAVGDVVATGGWPAGGEEGAFVPVLTEHP